MLQLVSEQGQWIFEGEVPDCSYTISVFGSQNSGKSTLLNALFQTQFRQLDTKVTRQQCTKGVWMQNRAPFNVIDTEGSDSLQRKDTLMEQFVALFAVSVSDIFIINLWNNEVGRYYGSQFNVLKNVFRSSLKVKNSPRKLVLFVIKDTPADQENHSVQRTLTDDLAKIWAEVLSEEPRYANAKLDRSFTFDFTFMSHYNRYRDKYIGEAAKLRSFIDSKAKSLSKRTLKVPGAELTHHYQELWTKITSMQEIDIANERRLTVEFCCRRVKRESLEALRRILVDSWQFEKNYNSYLKKTDAIASEYYKYSTTQLETDISDYILEELHSEVAALVAQQFHQIQNRKAECIIQSLETRLNGSLRRPDLLTRVQAGKEDAIEEFKDFLLATPSAPLFLKDFNRRLETNLVKYQEHVNRQILAFETQFEQTVKAWLQESVVTTNFNPTTLEKLFKEAVKAYGLQNTEHASREGFKRVVEKAFNNQLDEVLSTESKASVEFYNPFGTEETIVVHFREHRKKMEDYLKNLQTFVDTRDMDVRAVDRIRNDTLRNIDQEQAKQIDLNVMYVGNVETQQNGGSKAIFSRSSGVRLLGIRCDHAAGWPRQEAAHFHVGLVHIVFWTGLQKHGVITSVFAFQSDMLAKLPIALIKETSSSLPRAG